jgi:glycosyltransferase involved in cell wall biosynthesis
MEISMDYPKISIVTPSYNQAKFIEETICSVLDQAYPNLEYVIVDGGSQDGSVDIIKKYEKYLTWWISEPDKGHGNAINKGFSKTTGEIMAWLNSDDKYKDKSFFKVAEIFNIYNDVNWIVGKSGNWNKKGEFIREEFLYKNIYDFLLGDYKWIQQESTFWRRKLWNCAGGYINENYKFMIDGELWTRFFTFDNLWHINHVLAGYRQHDTNRAKIYFNEVIREMEEAISCLKKKLENSKNKLNPTYSIVDINKVINLTEKIKNCKIYTEEIPIYYNVIDYEDNFWKKKEVNYFAIKLKESSCIKHCLLKKAINYFDKLYKKTKK